MLLNVVLTDLPSKWIQSKGAGLFGLVLITIGIGGVFPALEVLGPAVTGGVDGWLGGVAGGEVVK